MGKSNKGKVYFAMCWGLPEEGLKFKALAQAKNTSVSELLKRLVDAEYEIYFGDTPPEQIIADNNKE